MASLAKPGRGKTHAHDSAYRSAIDATTDAIRGRARRYRNLVVSVSIVLVGTILVALITWSRLPLLLLAVAVPLYVGFAIDDARRLLSWQQQVLELWTEAQIDLRALSNTLGSVPGLPQRTVDGMLTLVPLPATAAAAEPRRVEIRRALAFVAREAHTVEQVQALATGGLESSHLDACWRQ